MTNANLAQETINQIIDQHQEHIAALKGSLTRRSTKQYRTKINDRISVIKSKIAVLEGDREVTTGKAEVRRERAIAKLVGKKL